MKGTKRSTRALRGMPTGYSNLADVGWRNRYGAFRKMAPEDGVGGQELPGRSKLKGLNQIRFDFLNAFGLLVVFARRFTVDAFGGSSLDELIPRP